MRAFTLIGAISCMALFFFTPDRVELGIVVFSFAAFGFWTSWVFYNSYLPEIALPEERDQVSARGFAMGYIGSVLLQLICFVIILQPSLLGIEHDKTLGPRISFLLVGIIVVTSIRGLLITLTKFFYAISSSNSSNIIVLVLAQIMV